MNSPETVAMFEQVLAEENLDPGTWAPQAVVGTRWVIEDGVYGYLLH